MNMEIEKSFVYLYTWSVKHWYKKTENSIYDSILYTLRNKLNKRIIKLYLKELWDTEKRNIKTNKWKGSHT